MQFDDVATAAFSKIPVAGLLGFSSASPNIGEFGPAWPYSFTNPIWVDVDGDGDYTPIMQQSFCTAQTDLSVDSLLAEPRRRPDPLRASALKQFRQGFGHGGR